ncbi:hypothetical protein GN330_07585 [Nitratireductor sp. CAU 1489]|uniref:Uncharacterized protein n=1 Tax=Nitratireductor arenosus TaxID=2682096 RepID=A0A844QH76_9HYPH|nr:hypothetical protein [Nitratireductor arenosus]MVA97109.1 hypothetical protein [Nitratireductor arenosus]
MDVHVAKGDRRTLRRIMALLVALAALAERAGARSWPVRCLVLCILRRAEAVATGFVADATGLPPSAPEAKPRIGNDAAGALRLAAYFRALAAALAALLRLSGRSRCPSGRTGGALRLPGPGQHGFAFSRGWTVLPNDTS